MMKPKSEGLNNKFRVIYGAAYGQDGVTRCG